MGQYSLSGPSVWRWMMWMWWSQRWLVWFLVGSSTAMEPLVLDEFTNPRTSFSSIPLPIVSSPDQQFHLKTQPQIVDRSIDGLSIHHSEIVLRRSRRRRLLYLPHLQINSHILLISDIFLGCVVVSVVFTSFSCKALRSRKSYLIKHFKIEAGWLAGCWLVGMHDG